MTNQRGHASGQEQRTEDHHHDAKRNPRVRRVVGERKSTYSTENAAKASDDDGKSSQPPDPTTLGWG